MRPFIPKQDHRLPDYYDMKINFSDGTTINHRVAQHWVTDIYLEFATHEDDIWHFVPLVNIKHIEFDKNFSKVIAIKQEFERKKKAESAKKAEAVNQ